ncbi:MAG TPA: hypothetical protein VM933_02850 [Acidimicrobiales bacterium]|nr:hypothetical protein [Acidimicrobiales bacterium]
MALVAVLLAAMAGGALVVRAPVARDGPPPIGPSAVGLEEAVRRTLAAGSARVHASLVAGGERVDLSGVVSLTGPGAEVTGTMPGAGPVDVRATADGTWLRTGGPEGAWAAVPPAAARLAAEARSWADLLAGLRPEPGAGRSAAAAGGRLRARSSGHPAQVEIDGAGRIRRLVVDRGRTTLDVRLADHGLPVHVQPP